MPSSPFLQIYTFYLIGSSQAGSTLLVANTSEQIRNLSVVQEDCTILNNL